MSKPKTARGALRLITAEIDMTGEQALDLIAGVPGIEDVSITRHSGALDGHAARWVASIKPIEGVGWSEGGMSARNAVIRTVQAWAAAGDGKPASTSSEAPTS